MPKKYVVRLTPEERDIFRICVSAKPYDARGPLSNMARTPVLQVADAEETRLAVATRSRAGLNVLSTTSMNVSGTAVNFMFTEPLDGIRRKVRRERKTAVDWAQEIKDLLDGHYHEARNRSSLVCAVNLQQGHKPAARYKAFSPEEARGRLAKRHRKPSTRRNTVQLTLNIAEIELRRHLSNQC